MKYWGIDLFANKPAFYINEVFKTNEKHTGLTFLNQIYKKETNNDILYYKDIDFYNRNEYVYRGNIWGVILSCYRYVIGYKIFLIDLTCMVIVNLENIVKNLEIYYISSINKKVNL